MTLGGAAIGLGLRYLLPGRDTQGALLLPAIGAIGAAVVWAAMTWLGWTFDGGWIWVLSLAASAVVAVAVDLLLARSRTAGDARMLQTLSRA